MKPLFVLGVLYGNGSNRTTQKIVTLALVQVENCKR